jgi:hypothetical protein
LARGDFPHICPVRRDPSRQARNPEQDQEEKSSASIFPHGITAPLRLVKSEFLARDL